MSRHSSALLTVVGCGWGGGGGEKGEERGSGTYWHTITD